MRPALVHFLAVLLFLSQGWLGAVRGHSLVVEVGGCDGSHAHLCVDDHGHDHHHHPRGEAPHRVLDALAAHLHDHADPDLGCHMHLCLPELEQRGTAPLDARGFAKLMPLRVLVERDEPRPTEGGGPMRVARWSKGPPEPDRLSLRATVLLL